MQRYYVRYKEVFVKREARAKFSAPGHAADFPYAR